ncbi:hypothetical protein ACHAXH_005744 [Discostella pseudostelligera]
MRSQSSRAVFSRANSWRRRQCPNRISTTSPLSYVYVADHSHRHFSSSKSSITKLAVDASSTDAGNDTRWRGNKSNLKDDGLTLSHFIASSSHAPDTSTTDVQFGTNISVAPADLGDEFYDEQDLIVTDAMSSSNKNEALDRLRHQIINTNEDSHDDEMHNMHITLKFHIKTYGCQMNVNDTDIVRSILMNNHTIAREDALLDGTTTKSNAKPQLRFIETDDEIQADVLLTNTCAIRENAEQKVWNRLRALRAHDRNFPLSSLEEDIMSNTNTLNNKTFKEQRKKRYTTKRQSSSKKRIIAVLGCMAERLKEDMFKDGTVDVVVGPDAYRDLPRLISVLTASSVSPDGKLSGANTLPTERAVNVQLSLEETYASIAPIRSNPNDVSAFVSIMRGCNNMCSYCVVPFTRGRERSREMESVVEETRRLLNEEGIKEIVLLGQNVNSYHDVRGEKGRGKSMVTDGESSSYRTSNDGFSNMFRLRHGDGYRFADLLEAVSDLSPELRIRFTSPHPKDYPPPLLSLMAERNNICKHLHMPAQSGSSAVLERMRRGYTREAYLELINDVKVMIPDVAISSDFISGFCGETEEEHIETLSLMQTVQYDQAFMFAYSMREKTHAHRTMIDDISPDVKNRRLNEIITCFRYNVQLRNEEVEMGKLRLVLVEGEAKSSTADNRMWSGRTDQNKRVVFASEDCFIEEEVAQVLSSNNACVEDTGGESLLLEDVANQGILKTRVGLSRGDFAVVRISEVRGHTLKGQSLWRGSMRGFEQMMTMAACKEGSSLGQKMMSL